MKNFTTFPAFPTGASEGLLYAAQVTMGSVKKIDILGPGVVVLPVIIRCLVIVVLQSQTLTQKATF